MGRLGWAILALVTILSVVTSGCGGDKELTPEDTISAFFHAVEAKDADSAYGYCDKSSVPKADIVDLVKEMETLDKVRFRNIEVSYVSREAEYVTVAVEYDMQITLQGKTETEHDTWTMNLKKIGGRWLYTYESAPPSGSKTPGITQAQFKVSNLRAVQSKPGENKFDITVDIQNTGGSAGVYELVSRVDGKDVGSDRITLKAGEKLTVPLVKAATKLTLLDVEAAYASRSTRGEKHIVSVDGLSVTVTFEETQTSKPSSPTPTGASGATEGWADFAAVAGNTSAKFYVIGNGTIYLSFEAAGQSVQVTAPKGVWAQPVYPENVPAEHMSKLKGGTIIGVSLTAPDAKYGYDITFSYSKAPTGVIGTGDIRAGEYRPVGIPQPAPADQSTYRIYAASPLATSTPKPTPTPTPTSTFTPTLTPTPTPTVSKGGLPDLVISDIWLAGQGRGLTTPCGTKSKDTGGNYVRIAGNVMDGSQYEDFQVWYTVKNIGTASIPRQYAGSLGGSGTSLLIDNKFSGDSYWVYGTDDGTALDPGETTPNAVPINLLFHDFTPGTHTITLRVNWDGAGNHNLKESNYENNQVTLTLTKVACPK